MSADALARVRALGCDVVLADAEHLKLVGPREARAQVRDLVLANKPALLAHLRGQAGAKVLPFILPRRTPVHSSATAPAFGRTPQSAPNDVQALAQHLEALGREAAIASERRLWAWWLGSPQPTVAAFLAIENQDAGDRGKGAA